MIVKIKQFSVKTIISKVGVQGPVGVGFPVGGSTGQVLKKNSATNYDATWQTLTKGDVGLGNVDNTSDLNKPISTATQTALNGKFNNPTGNTSQYIRGDGSIAAFPETVKLTTTVYNQTGSPIPAGKVVYINGAHGNLPTITLSLANSEATSSKTYGVTQATIGNNSSGSIVAFGLVSNLDTFALTEGVALWLSPTVAGDVTMTKPVAPNHAVFIGFCTRAHPTQGTIEAKIQNGFELEELHNVLIQSISDGQVLTYDSATSLWKNKAIPDVKKVVATVLNNTASTIPAFSPVYITGQSGGVPTIALARNTNQTESHLFGITTSAILSGQTGNVVTEGLIEGVNTSSISAGAMVFLGSTVGSLTITKPTQPTSIVYCGHVIASDATNGSFMVNIINAIRLTELAGLAISSPIQGHAIAYNAGAVRWENRFLTKTDVGLANVDNTSDANKPVSTAQQTAINAKVADSITNGVTTIAPSQNAVFDALALKQNYFGTYTPENIANKATDLSTINDTLYPSVQLVNNSFVKKVGDDMTGPLVNNSNEPNLTDNYRAVNGNTQGASCYRTDNKVGSISRFGLSDGSFSTTEMIGPDTSFIFSTAKFVFNVKTELRFGIDSSEVGSFIGNRFTAGQIDAKPIDILGLDTGTPVSSDEIMFYESGHSENRRLAFSEFPISNAVTTELENYSKTPQIDTFSTSGTWTKPTGAKLVEVILVGASAGGGSGRVGAAGTAATGGGGGGSPAIVHFKFDAADLDATETITVGAAGVGGAAVSTNDTDGIDGTSGGETSIGVGVNTKLRTYSTNPGLGGKNGVAATGGASSIGATAFNTGQGSGGASSATGAIGSSGTNSSGFNTVGGASAGGVSTANVPANGGAGSRWTSISVLPQTSGGAGGTTAGSADAGNGVLNAMKIYGIQLGTGAGGGAGATNRNGGNGGNGVGFSGGGGGGATRNGYTSGKGGNGVDGYVVIITHF